MATKERRYLSTTSSVEALENRCNFDELNIPGKLQSLTAATDTAGVKVTYAIYEKIPIAVGVGNLKIKTDAGGSSSGWIMTVETKLQVSR